MSKVVGVLLIILGVGVAAYQLAVAYERAPQTLQDTGAAAKFATTVSLAAMSAPQPIELPSVKAVPAASKPLPPSPAPAQQSQSWPPFVTQVHRDNERVRVAQAMPQMQRPDFQRSEIQRPAINPTDHASLARELQRELTRVGCYGGEINSTWTMSTKRAMKAFMDRVNATLPMEQPDQVLLALVKSHTDNVCGKPCPQGQGLSDAGRCLPNAILARANKATPRALAGSAPKGKTREPPPSWATTTTVATPARPALATAAPPLAAPVQVAPIQHEPAPEGRMALAGPHAEGSSLSPAAPMSSDGVSVLPAPPPSGYTQQQGAFEPRRASRQAQGGNGWARSFLKRRESTN